MASGSAAVGLRATSPDDQRHERDGPAMHAVLAHQVRVSAQLLKCGCCWCRSCARRVQKAMAARWVALLHYSAERGRVGVTCRRKFALGDPRLTSALAVATAARGGSAFRWRP